MYTYIFPDSIFGVFLRFLWPRYGIFFDNDPFLQNAAMLKALNPALGPTALPLFRQRFSQLQRQLARALETKTLKESHLLALYFIISTSRSKKWTKEEFDWTNFRPIYLNGVVQIIRHLKTTSRTEPHHFEFWPWLLYLAIDDMISYPESYPITDDMIETMWTVFSLWRDLGRSIPDTFPTFHWMWHGYRVWFAHEIFFAIRTCLLSFLITPLTGHPLSEQRKQEIEKAVPLINQRIEHFITTHETMVTILDPLVCPLRRELLINTRKIRFLLHGVSTILRLHGITKLFFPGFFFHNCSCNVLSRVLRPPTPRRFCRLFADFLENWRRAFLTAKRPISKVINLSTSLFFLWLLFFRQLGSKVKLF